MNIETIPIAQTIAKRFNASTGSVIIEIFNNVVTKELPGEVVVINGFLKNLKAHARIGSLAPVKLPNFTLEDSETDKLYKTLDIQWNSARKQLNLYLSDNQSAWYQVGAISLLNPSGYPYRIYNLMDLLTENLAEEFPITVPDTMIEPHKEGAFAKIFGFIDGKKKRKINTIAELIAWMSEQDSAVLGQFHQVVEFETGGKDKKGQASKATVVLPNVAETLKEIIILTSQMALQNNVQTELIFKIASEVVATRAAAHKSALIAADIQDYLDYPTETKSAEIATNVNFPRVKQNKK